MTASRTVYDEVREAVLRRNNSREERQQERQRDVLRWRSFRDMHEDAILQLRLDRAEDRHPGFERTCLIQIAALAIAQIEALDRRAESAK
jgi:hypothetical protein